MKTAPHYLLLTGSQNCCQPDNPSQPPSHQQHPDPCSGRWHFVLEPINGGRRIEADEIEPGVTGERLNLLAIVRGIEALEQPSIVTLITPSAYVGRGLRSGIATWREQNWQWERFGEMAPIKHAKLWQRIDRANQIHKIDCRIWAAGNRRTRLNRPQAQALGQAMFNGPVRNSSALGRHDGPETNLTANSTADQLSGSPYETPFATAHGPSNSEPPRHSTNRRGGRKIVLTSQRMNDPRSEVEDIERLRARHRQLFRATRRGWERVTEIGPDVSSDEVEAKVFGCSVN